MTRTVALVVQGHRIVTAGLPKMFVYVDRILVKAFKYFMRAAR